MNLTHLSRRALKRAIKREERKRAYALRRFRDAIPTEGEQPNLPNKELEDVLIALPGGNLGNPGALLRYAALASPHRVEGLRAELASRPATKHPWKTRVRNVLAALNWVADNRSAEQCKPGTERTVSTKAIRREQDKRLPKHVVWVRKAEERRAARRRAANAP